MRKLSLTLTMVLVVFTMSAIAQNELFNKGLQQFEAKQYAQAAETFKQVVTQTPNFYQAHFNLGLCFYNLNRVDEAISSFQRSVVIKPDYARANYWLGNAFSSQKRYDDAIIWYQKTLQYEPSNANAYYKIGLIYQEQKKYPDAEKSLKRATELKPDEADFKTELGNVYVSQKMFPAAISVFNDSIRLKPASPSAHLGLGNAYYNDKRFAESIPYYKKSTELSPNWVTAHLYLGDAYYKTKQYSLAVSEYETAISLDSKKADSHYGLGLTYIALKNKAKAQTAVNNLLPLDKLKADLLQTEVNKLPGASVISTPKPTAKTAQRIKDEQDVAKMADFGFDGAVVIQSGQVRESPKTTGKLLLAVKRGDILSLVERQDSNGFYQVVDEKTGLEGWIDGKSIVIKLTTNTATGPPLLETGTTSSNANPVLIVSNLEERTTLSLRINGTLYQIPPKSTKNITVQPGKMNYYGWSAGIRPAVGSSNVVSGRQYSWSFKINRR